MNDDEFLKENNICISKITYSYDFPYNFLYKINKRGSSRNEERNLFLESVYDRLFKTKDDSIIVLNRPHYIIELKYFYLKKYYNININNERIVFHNIDYENIDEVNVFILDLIGYNLIEMGIYQTLNIMYRIDFKSCHINNMIETSFDDFMFDKNIDTRKQLMKDKNYDSQRLSINVCNKNHNPKFKIRLYGRNKWLILQNMKYSSTNDFIIFYKYIKSLVILPNLLKYLYKNKHSLFSCLLPEIIDIITNILYN